MVNSAYPDEASRHPSAYEPRPRHRVIIDIHIVVLRRNRVLLGLRCNTGYADGEFHLPAGHLEPKESITAAAVREAQEELGITIRESDLQLVHTMHRCAPVDRLSLFFTAPTWGGKPRN